MRPQAILLLSFLAFAACRHTDVDVQPPSLPPVVVTPIDSPAAAPTFGISGDTAVVVMQARTVDATFFLADSGAGQQVNLSVSGLPPGVTADWTTNARVTPPGQATLRITAGPILNGNPSPLAPAGASTIATVRAVMTNGTEKTHSIRVTVMENPNCAELRVGTYKLNGGSYNVYVSVDPAFPTTRIRLSNFPYSGRGSYAVLDCATNTLAFPRQNIALINFFLASGSFTEGTIEGTGKWDHSGNGVYTDSSDFILVR